MWGAKGSSSHCFSNLLPSIVSPKGRCNFWCMFVTLVLQTLSLSLLCCCLQAVLSKIFLRHLSDMVKDPVAEWKLKNEWSEESPELKYCTLGWFLWYSAWFGVSHDGTVPPAMLCCFWVSTVLLEMCLYNQKTKHEAPSILLLTLSLAMIFFFHSFITYGIVYYGILKCPGPFILTETPSIPTSHWKLRIRFCQNLFLGT